ncbi:MAG: histidine phosphatase family protein [Rhodospirillales bacterium]
MKILYLLRHAKSSWKDSSLDDFDRPLKKRGRRAGKLMATYLRDQGISPDLILCSAAKRALQTLEYIHQSMDANIPVEIKEELYHASPKGLLERLARLDDGVNQVMVIGHNPGLETLAANLAGDAEATSLKRMTSKYPTAALAVLKTSVKRWRELGPGGARLEQFVCPRDLES